MLEEVKADPLWESNGSTTYSIISSRVGMLDHSYGQPDMRVGHGHPISANHWVRDNPERGLARVSAVPCSQRAIASEGLSCESSADHIPSTRALEASALRKACGQSTVVSTTSNDFFVLMFQKPGISWNNFFKCDT